MKELFKKNNEGFNQHLLFNKKISAGFTLLYASMVSGLLLAIGAAILNITVKQITLSAAGRESQFAFYNADTGTECALYLYRSSKSEICPAGLFPAVGDTSNTDSYCSSLPSISKCLEVPINYTPPNTCSLGNCIYKFKVDTSPNSNICFDVTVDRSTPNVTKIISKGYNTCSNVNKFERAIEVDF